MWQRWSARYLHPFVMLISFLIIWWLTRDTSLFLALVGAEIVSMFLHQRRYHPGELFDHKSARILGIALVVLGLTLRARTSSLPELIFRPLLLFGTQCLSNGWHSHQHSSHEDMNSLSFILLGGILTLLCAASLIVSHHFP